ncbi:predicted protein [Streptomyces sp. SPB78]|nr:predicted protein [Streptomyces sp. SPB78]
MRTSEAVSLRILGPLEGDPDPALRHRRPQQLAGDRRLRLHVPTNSLRLRVRAACRGSALQARQHRWRGPLELHHVRPARTAPGQRLQPLPHRPRSVLGTAEGVLSYLPQRNALAAYLTKVATTDEQHTTGGAQYDDAHPAIIAWTQNKAADRGTNELSLSDLEAMMQS